MKTRDDDVDDDESVPLPWKGHEEAAGEFATVWFHRYTMEDNDVREPEQAKNANVRRDSLLPNGESDSPLMLLSVKDLKHSCVYVCSNPVDFRSEHLGRVPMRDKRNVETFITVRNNTLDDG